MNLRQSKSLDIRRSLQVAVVLGPADETRPLTVGKCQIMVDCSASTGSTRRFKLTDPKHIYSATFGFVLNLPYKLTPRSALNMTSKAMVLNHTSNVQRLKAYR